MCNCCILSPFLLGASGMAGPAWATCKYIKNCACVFFILTALYKDVKYLISVFSHFPGTTWTTRTEGKFCNNLNLQCSALLKVKITGSSSNILLVPVLKEFTTCIFVYSCSSFYILKYLFFRNKWISMLLFKLCLSQMLPCRWRYIFKCIYIIIQGMQL